MLTALFDILTSVLGKVWFNVLIVLILLPIFVIHVIGAGVKRPIKAIGIVLAAAVAFFTLVPLGRDTTDFGFGSWEAFVIVLFSAVVLFVFTVAASVLFKRNDVIAKLYLISLPTFFILLGLASFNVIAAVASALLLIANITSIAIKKHLV